MWDRLWNKLPEHWKTLSEREVTGKMRKDRERGKEGCLSVWTKHRLLGAEQRLCMRWRQQAGQGQEVCALGLDEPDLSVTIW